MRPSSVSTFALCALTLALSGCYTTTVRSGRPVDPQPAVYRQGVEFITFQDKWHHGFVLGLVESGGNYNLAAICPNGWSEVTTETSFLSGLVGFASVGIYSPQTVSIRCTAENVPPGASALPGVPPPQPMAPPATTPPLSQPPPVAPPATTPGPI